MSSSRFSFPRYQQIELKMTQLHISPLQEEEIYVISAKCTVLLMRLSTVKLYNDSSPLDKGASMCAGLVRSFHHLRSCN